MRCHKRHLAPRSRAALAWGVGLFLAAQLAFNLTLERWRPELRDPDYGLKLKVLRRAEARAGGRPLVLVLGSSRVQTGVRASELTAAGAGRAVFNFGVPGAGPVAELLFLRRLLADGVRPEHVVVEVLAPLLGVSGQADSLGPDRLAWGDLALMRRYALSPEGLTAGWWRGRLLPCYSCRFRVLACLVPSLLAGHAGAHDPYAMAGHYDASGWLGLPTENLTAAERARGLALARRGYQPYLADFHIADDADRALRELVALCRRERIGVALLLMPEGTEFRALYPPAVRAAIDAYLARLRREQGLPLVDARDWVGDDGFWDSHHLTRAGAATFTGRFGREALPALLRARPGETAVAEGRP